MDVSVDVTVDVSPWERDFLKALGATLMVFGLLGGLVHVLAPYTTLLGTHPLLPPAIVACLLGGLSLVMGFDSVDEGEDGELPPPQVLGILAAVTGLVMFPVGLLAPTPFIYAAGCGFGLFVLGVVVTGLFDPGWPDDGRDLDEVPDDPMELLDDGGEDQ